MTNFTTNYETEYAEIERMAFLIKFSNLEQGKKANLENKILGLILKVKGMGAFACPTDVEGKCLSEYKGYSTYAGDVIYDMYRDVMRKFGYKDNATGEIIPFMQLFNYMYNLRKNRITKVKREETDDMNVKVKNELMSELFRKNVKMTKNDHKINLMNLDNVKKVLIAKGCGDSVLRSAENIMGSSYVGSDVIEIEGSEEGCVIQSDSVAVTRYADAASAMQAIAGGLDNALLAAKSPTLKKYITYLVTIKATHYVPTAGTSNGVYLDCFLDKDFYHYLCTADSDADEVRLLADYLHQERETVRKNLRKAALFLMEQKGRCA